MSTINFLTPGFNKAGQNNLDNQGGLIGPENDPVINDLVTIFTSPGTFNRTKTEGTVLVVAGGGGAANRSGGGGAGGARVATSHPFPSSGVPVTVGSGGAGDGPYPWSNGSGSGSTFGSSIPISCTGGGRGGNRPYPPGQNSIPRKNGAPGGSGGGAARAFGGTPTSSGGSGISGEGNNGGQGTQDWSGYSGGGGGANTAADNSGGAAGDGLNISPYFPGTTSIGTLNSPDGGYYVAGGGRGSAGSGPNGIGGGSSGQNGTSGGGGGSSYSNPGGTGGDGVVAVAEAGAGPSRSSGMWNLKAVYTARINDNWPS